MNEAVPPRAASYYLGDLLLVKDRTAANTQPPTFPSPNDAPMVGQAVVCLCFAEGGALMSCR